MHRPPAGDAAARLVGKMRRDVDEAMTVPDGASPWCIRSTTAAMSAPAAVSATTTPHPKAGWTFRAIGGESGDGLFQAGPWFVDVRLSTVGEKLTLRSGAHELRRYLTFAEASGDFAENAQAGDKGCALCDTMYAKKLQTAEEELEVKLQQQQAGRRRRSDPFGWLCNMT
eukprot:scaffold96577_cov69-Phaeocystis_antarctica.AAC.3